MKNIKILIMLGISVLLIISLLTFINSDITSSEGNLNEWRMFRAYLNHTAWDGISYYNIPGLNRANYSTGSYIFSSPAIANGYVYFGNTAGSFYQLNATNVSNKIINFSAGSTISSSPAIANGSIYFGTDDGILYQMNESNISQQIASYNAGSTIFSSPAVANGFVYICNDDGYIYQLNAINVSQQIANYSTGSAILSSPAVANGYVYFGNNAGSFYQLNATNVSQQIANYTAQKPISSSPAVAYGFVYFGDDNHTFYQLNATNVSQQIANYTAESPVYSSPAVANGYVYFGDYNGIFYQLNASNISLDNGGGGDTIYPIFSNNLTSIANGSQYNPGNSYQFNITITNTNGTTGIDFNGNNYTLSNISNSFYKTIGSLGAGTYSYYYWAYGNGASNNFNNSETYSYTIAKNSSYVLNVGITPSSTVTYPTQTVATGSGCPESICNLYRNAGILGNPNTVTLGVGVYNYTFNTTGSANYSSNSASQILTVNINSSSCSIQFNSTSPQTYPYKFLVYNNCTTDSYITRNGTIISNNSEQDLSAGQYNFTVYRNDTTNYTNIIDSKDFQIQQNTSLSIYTYLNNSRANITIYNNTAIWLNGTLNGISSTIKLYKNGTLINSGTSPISNLTNFNGTGIYNITTIYEGNTNYSSKYETWWVNVTTAPDTIPPSINITYPLNTTYTANVSALNYTFVETNPSRCWYSNSSGVWNSTDVAAGVNFSNSTGYCANPDPSCNTQTTCTSVCWAPWYPTPTIFSVEGSNTWTVYCNDTAGNVNSSSVTFFKDSIYPVVNIIYPINNTYYNFNTVNINYTRSDTNLGSCWYSNDSYSANLSLGSGGVCTNITNVTWTEGNHNVTIWVNDSAGSINSSRITFNVDTIFPIITNLINDTTNSTYVRINWTVNEPTNYSISILNSTGSGQNCSSASYLSGDSFCTNDALIPNTVYYVNLTVCDLAGNCVSNNTFNFTSGISTEINFTNPTLSSGSSITAKNIEINVTASFAAGLKNITIYFYNSTDLINSTNSTSSPLYINFQNLADGVYYFNATAYDNTGIPNSTETRNITIYTEGTGGNIGNFYPNYSLKVNLITHYYRNNIEVNQTVYTSERNFTFLWIVWYHYIYSKSFDSVSFDIQAYNPNPYFIDNLLIVDSNPKINSKMLIAYLEANDTKIIAKTDKVDISHYTTNVTYMIQVAGRIQANDIYGYGTSTIIKPVNIKKNWNILFWLLLIIIIISIYKYIKSRQNRQRR